MIGPNISFILIFFSVLVYLHLCFFPARGTDPVSKIYLRRTQSHIANVIKVARGSVPLASCRFLIQLYECELFASVGTDVRILIGLRLFGAVFIHHLGERDYAVALVDLHHLDALCGAA